MPVLDVALTWIHVLGAVVFLGTMFVGTFVLLPVLKANLEYEPRHKFIVNFIPRVRGVVRVFVAVLVLSGVARAVLLHLTHEGEAGAARLGVFGLKLFFAAVPVLIFLLAPRILGAKTEEHLCCDPDADDSPVFKGVMTTKGAALHYTAIAGGWLAALCGVVLGHIR